MIDTVKLKKLREYRCLTQAQLADKAGLSREHYNRLERWGGSSVTGKTLSKLCKALNVEAREFWTEDEV